MASVHMAWTCGFSFFCWKQHGENCQLCDASWPSAFPSFLFFFYYIGRYVLFRCMLTSHSHMRSYTSAPFTARVPAPVILTSCWTMCQGKSKLIFWFLTQNFKFHAVFSAVALGLHIQRSFGLAASFYYVWNMLQGLFESFLISLLVVWWNTIKYIFFTIWNTSEAPMLLL